jgi:hypothetical protein
VKKINDGKCKLIFLLFVIAFVEFRISLYQSTISNFEYQCRRQRNPKNPVTHAACVAKNSQKKEENALVARRVTMKRAMSVTRRSSQAKE